MPNEVVIKLRIDASDLKTIGTTVASQLNAMGNTATQAGAKTAKGMNTATASMNNFHRGAGAAANSFGRFNAASTVAGKVIGAVTQQTGLAAKAMAGFKAYAGQAAAIGTGFLAVNATIRAVTQTVTFMKDAFLDLDEAVTQSMAIVSGNTKEAKDELKDLSREISGSLRINAKEVADGFYYLASAGLDLESAVNVLPIATKYAQAGLIDMAKATEQLMDVTTTFGDTLLDGGETMRDEWGDVIPEMMEKGVTRVADVLAKASIDSNASLDDMAMGVQGKAGAMAVSLDQSLEDVTASVMAFSSVGIKGATANTYYSMALRDLSSKALKNGEAFREMGIQVYNSSGQMNPLQDIISQMSISMNGLTTEQQRASLLQLGLTDRSVQATLALMSQSQELQIYRARLDDASGSVEKIAGRQLDSFRAKLDLLTNNLQNISSAGIETFLEGLEKVGSELEPLGRALGEFFGPFLEGAKGALTVFGQIAGGIGGLGLKGLANGLAPLISNFAELTTVVRGLGMIAMVKFTQSIMHGIAASKIWQGSVDGTALRITAAGARIDSAMARIRASLATTTTAYQLAGGGMSGAAAATSAAVSSAWERMAARIRGSNASISASQAAVAKSSTASGSKMAAAASIGTMALMAGVMAWQNQISEATTKVEGEISTMLEGVDTDTYAGMAEGANKLAAAQNVAADATSGLGEAWSRQRFGAMFETIESFWGKGDNGNETITRYAKLTEETQKLVDKKDGVEKLTEVLRGQTGFTGSLESVARAAKATGINLEEFNRTGEISEGQVKSMASAANTYTERVKLAAGGAVDFATIAEESYTEIVEKSDELAKATAKMFVDMTNPAAAYKDMMIDVSSATDVFNDLVSDLTSKRDEAVDASKDIFDASTQSQIDALESQRESELKALSQSTEDRVDTLQEGADAVADAEDDVAKDVIKARKKATDQQVESTQDAADAQKDSIKSSYDAQIDALKAGQEAYNQQQDDAKNGDVSPGLQQMSDALDAEIAKYKEYRTGLNKLVTMEGVEDPVSLYQFFSEMEPEKGQELLTSILTSGTDFVNSFSAKMKELETLEQPTWDATLASIDKRMQTMQSMSGNIVALTQMFPDFKNEIFGIATSLGDEAPQALADLMERVKGGDKSGVEGLLQKWAATNSMTVEQTVTALQSATDLLSLGTQATTAEVDNAIGKFDIDHWTTLLKANGFDEGTVGVIKQAILTHLSVAGEEGRKMMSQLLTLMGEDAARAMARMKDIQLGQQWATHFKKIGTASDDDYAQWGKNVRENKWELPGYTPMIYPNADGNIHSGENHVAQIGKSTRMWAEPETGGEAYIPLAASKRQRSMALLSTVAEMFGARLVPGEAAGVGGYRQDASKARTGAPVPMSSTKSTTFTGPIIGTNIQEVQAYAERAERRNNLVGG